MSGQKKALLPRMAANNIHKNGSSYFPYIGVSIFAMFSYFSFDMILCNDIMLSIPRAVYATMLIRMGFSLLGFIMVPFLYYTNSFLIKRRKKELGLYSILGLEKKHIGIMMFYESLIIYAVVMVASIGIGLLFSRLVFLFLINLAGLPVEASFAISPKAIVDALLFYAIISGLNLFVNLVQVGKSNPVELMRDSGKGEKEPKHIILGSLTGILFLGLGYYMAMTTKIDSMIFINFFLEVICVVIGTYFLFTAGSVVLLRIMKKNKKSYYRADNFITVSGMLYRMKKNAASLANICIFGTMVIVTAVCTLSVFLGMDSIMAYTYPSDIRVSYYGGNREERESVREEIFSLADSYGLGITEYLDYEYCEIPISLEGKALVRKDETSDRLRLATLAEYNRIEGTNVTLKEGEVLLYCSAADCGIDNVQLGDREFTVKEELTSCLISGNRKEPMDTYGLVYVLVLPDEQSLGAVAGQYGVDATVSLARPVGFRVEGEGTAYQSFYEELEQRVGQHSGFAMISEHRGRVEELKSAYGGLLFVGIFFGLVFLICLLVIMYYKQIAEGYEDQKSFEIMQKVGMSDREINRTIHKQIRLVFALPLIGAIMHTIVAMKVVVMLMSTIRLFATGMIICCVIGVCLIFALFYVIFYKKTASVYYRIVKWN